MASNYHHLTKFLFIIVITIISTACGGGGGSRSNPAPMQTCSDGSTIPTADTCPPPPLMQTCPDNSIILATETCPVIPAGSVWDYTTGRGSATSDGINRIPLTKIMQNNQQIAEQFVVVEYLVPTSFDYAINPNSARDSNFNINNVRNYHGSGLRTVACNGYVTGCDDPFEPSTAPFTFLNTHANCIVWGDCRLPLTTSEAGDRPGITNFAEDINDRAPAKTKIVSISAGPIYLANNLVVNYAANLRFSVVHSAGNDNADRLFRTPAEASVIEIERFGTVPSDLATILATGHAKIREAIAADKVLYVAGYVRDAAGSIVRADNSSGFVGSTGCVGAEVGAEYGCIYEEYIHTINLPASTVTPQGVSNPPAAHRFAGTSGSAPRVAAALASVLAVFPDTSGVELIKLAKTCARPVATLPGDNGKVADFSCMTFDDGAGGWSLVADTNTILNPMVATSLSFPGNTQVRVAISRPGKSLSVTLAATRAGRFDTAYRFSSGIPTTLDYRDKGMQTIGGKNIFGAHYRADWGLFAAATVSSRTDFFGLGDYSRVYSYDAELGHRNAFIRLSQQYGKAKYINNATGSAIGITLQRYFNIGNTQLHIAAEADRFLGGKADTVFGVFNMKKSKINRRMNVNSVTVFANSTLRFNSEISFPGQGGQDTTFSGQLNFRPNDTTTITLSQTALFSTRNSTDNYTNISLEARW